MIPGETFRYNLLFCACMLGILATTPIVMRSFIPVYVRSGCFTLTNCSKSDSMFASGCWRRCSSSSCGQAGCGGHLRVLPGRRRHLRHGSVLTIW